MQRLASVTTTTTAATAAAAAEAAAAAATTMTTAVITNDDPIGDWREGAQRREKGRRARSVPIDERAYISHARYAKEIRAGICTFFLSNSAKIRRRGYAGSARARARRSENEENARKEKDKENETRMH